ncbi:hypothetical protein [Haliangium sp.]|uniref:hypothetical protein n=1 Tax=Haliangium sp. TaxID=2663208 RepID=UPI003D0D9376
MPKSSASEKAYEWSNYRLACSRMNSRKGTFDDVLDPFLVEDGWFSLNLVSFEVKPSANLDPALSNEVQVTIDRLGLNERDCRTARERDYEVHWQMHRDATCLRRLSPFVAREAERHGLLSDMAMSEHERGHRAGLCDALRYQIEHRFNRPLAREEALRIAGADDDQLRDWLQRVLTSESCEELFEQ